MIVEPSADSAGVADVGLPWNRTDELLVGILTMAALVTRFWRLGYPDEPVFDELQFVGQAMAFLRGEQFTCVHPNLAPLLMASAVKLLGFHSWAWRSPGALLGVALIPVTYLLGREMFRSRIAAVLCASFVLCDGMFLIHSRLGMLEIFHLTFTATSYLLLFLLLRTGDHLQARRRLLYLAIVSGAALATKLMIPEIGFLLVIGFLTYGMISREWHCTHIAYRRIMGTILVLISGSSIVYLATFMPDYYLGWWGGSFALIHYYREVIFQLGSISEMTNRFVSPWWSWPFMLRAPLYWQTRTDLGQIATIWEGGNPVLWWTSLVAIAITAVKEFRRPVLSRTFLLFGYAGYMFALAISKHPFYLYIYMAPLYLQYLMLAALLADCWNGSSRPIEHIVLILSLAPGLLFGLGTTIGTGCLVAMVGIYGILSWRLSIAGKFVCIVLIVAAAAAFLYFLPLWLGIPLDPVSYENRIWLNGSGLLKWM